MEFDIERVVEYINKFGFAATLSAKALRKFAEIFFGIRYIYPSRRFRTGITPKPNRIRRRQRHTRLQRRHNRQNKNRRKA